MNDGDMGGFCCSLACSLDSPDHQIPSSRPLQVAVDWQPIEPASLRLLSGLQQDVIIIFIITVDLGCCCPAR